MASKTRLIVSACVVVALAVLLFSMGRPASVSAKNTAPVDETAVNALQLNVHYRFGPGTHPGTDCDGTSTSTGYCFASGHFTVPQGKRFVIENISAVVGFPSTSMDTMAQIFSLATQVNNTVCFHTLPFDRIVTVGQTTYYYANKSVRIYVDPAIGFPKIDLGNLAGLGPVFTHDTGYANFVVSGYLVDFP
jgi:hypothetical protein